MAARGLAPSRTVPVDRVARTRETAYSATEVTPVTEAVASMARCHWAGSATGASESRA